MEDTQTIEAPQVAAPPQDDLTKLYNTVKGAGLYTKSYDEFKQKYSDPDNIDKLYGIVNQSGLYTRSKDEFYSKYYPTVQPQKRLATNMSIYGDKAIDELTQQEKMNQYYSGLQETTEKQSTTYVRQPPPDFRFKDEVETERNNYKQQMVTDPAKFRQVAAKIIQRNPSIAPQVQSDAYEADATARNADPKIIKENKQKIESGDYKYNPVTQKLEEPTGLLKSIGVGWDARQTALKDYDYFKSHNTQENIDKLELDRQKFDPDKATPTPAGIGGFGKMTSMIGSEGVGTAKAIIGGGIPAAIPGLEEFAPMAAAAASSPEYYKRGKATALQQHYDDLRRQGLSKEDAYKKADELSDTDAKLDAAQMALTSVIGARIGLHETPKIDFGPGVMGTVKGLAQKGGHFIAENANEGIANALGGATVQIAKNVNANKDPLEGVGEVAADQFLLPYMIGGVIHGGKEIGIHAVKLIKQTLSKIPEPILNDHLGTMAHEGIITPEQAVDVKGQLQRHQELDSRIPDKVEDEDTRIKLQDHLQKRDELEQQSKTVAKPYQPEIKEKIATIDEKINELTAKKTEDAIQEQKTGEVLQRQPGETGKPGSERTGVEPGQQGEKTAAPSEEEKIESARQAELKQASKPNLKLDRVSNQDIVNSDDALANKKTHDDIQARFKRVRQLIDCLWQ
jgi:hypothetical protein